jgi:putative hemolysin
MEALIIFALIQLNSVFALSELAIVSARRTRLQEFADAGSNRAKVALALSQQPNRFLATVQVGITLVGVLAGAFGGATLSADVAEPLRRLSPIETYADSIAFALVVGVTTYLSLVIGELVPKHLALRNPEGIAMLVARPMMALSWLFTPIVWILNQSTNFILWGLRSKRTTETDISENEIIQMIRQGIKSGVFEQTEQELVEDIFRLDDYRVTEIMIPRTEVVWLDMDAPYEEQQRTVLEHSYSYYPVYRGDFDKVHGMVRAKDVLSDGRRHGARGGSRRPLVAAIGRVGARAPVRGRRQPHLPGPADRFLRPGRCRVRRTSPPFGLRACARVQAREAWSTARDFETTSAR